MSDATTYQLWCIVEGNNNPFSIIASSTTYVDDLREKVKVENSNLLREVDASDLTLWKVRYF
jgi:hypothetical protein